MVSHGLTIPGNEYLVFVCEEFSKVSVLIICIIFAEISETFVSGDNLGK